MKKLFLVPLALFTCTLFAQNVPNPGFENWEDQFQYETPKNWNNSNLEGRGRTNVSKSSDHKSGDYAILLQNHPDSSFGYFLMGKTGDDGPDGGVPYASKFDSVTGWYKCDMKPGDTALVLTFKYTSTDTTMTTSKLFGTVNQWTRFSFPVDTLSQSEVFFGVVSSNPFSGQGFHPDSWVLIDDVAFAYSGPSTPAALPNNSFELWDSVAAFEPVEWNSFNTVTGDSVSVSRSEESHSGQYAIKVKTIPAQDGRKVGWAFTGDLPTGPEGFTGGFAYDAVPTSLSGYYKYYPNGQDTGMILVTGSEYDAGKDSTLRVFVAATLITPKTGYQQFSIPIQYDTSKYHIDTVNIVIVSSKLIFDHPEQAPDGSYMLVDDLWLSSKCDYLDTISVFSHTDTVIQYAPPNVPTIGTDSTWSAYLWSTGDTTREINITSDTNNLSILVTDVNGCKTSGTILVILEDTTGMSVNPLFPDVRVHFYPNPTHGSLTFKSTGLYNGDVVIRDLMGRIVYHQRITSELIILELRNLISGSYLIEWSDSRARIGQQKILLMRE